MANNKSNSRKPANRTTAAKARSGNPAVRAEVANKAKPHARPTAPAASAVAKPATAPVKTVAPKTGKTPAVKGPKLKPKLGHAHGLTIGDRAPAFTLKTATGKTNLNLLRKESSKGLIIFFFPKAASKACTTEAIEFRDSYQKLKKAGYEVVGISPDDPQELKRFQAEHKLPFTLASDQGSKVARKYGAYGKTHKYRVTATMPDPLHRAVPKVEAPLRATFVLDAGGRVAQVVPAVQAKGHVGRLLKRLGLSA
jgi:peroxiredoxin Q/BCP